VEEGDSKALSWVLLQ